MKKIIALLLALVMCFGCLIACGPAAPAVSLEDAKTFLQNMYQSDEGKATPVDYKVVAKVVIEEVTFNVTWASSSDKVKIEDNSNASFKTVNVPDSNDTEFTYKLTATITNDAGESVALEFTRKMPVVDNTGVVTAPEADTPYKLFLYQVNKGQTLYATHTMDQGKYYVSTNDAKQAPDFFAEASGDGFKFYTMIDGAKKYVDAKLEAKEDGKYSKILCYADTTDNAWVYKAETNAWFTFEKQGDLDVEYVFGTYGTYTTFCISEASYISASNTGVSQFPAGLMAKDVAEGLTPDEEIKLQLPQMNGAVQPVVGTAYNFGFVHGKLDNKVLYITGVLSGHYMGTSEAVEDAAVVYVEEATGGYYMYTNVDGAKKYINMVVSGTYVNGKYEDAAATVYTYDAELKTFKAVVNDTDYIFGTSAVNTYETIGPVKSNGEAFYAQFVPAQEFTNAQKIAYEKANFSISTTITKAGEVVLPLTGKSFSDVAVAWELVEASDYAALAGNTLTVTLPAADATIKLKATFTIGEEPAVYNEYTVTIKAPGAMTPAEILDAAYALEKDAKLEGEYTLTGVITVINTAYSSSFKNISVTIVVNGIADKPIQAYRLTVANKDDAAELAKLEALKIGDTITVTGVIKNYNGTVEFDAGCILGEVVPGESQGPAETITTIQDALDPANVGKDAVLEGVVVSVTAWNTQHGNNDATIKDANGNKILVYRLATQVGLGDTIKVTGKVGTYNDANQIAQGATAEILTVHGDNHTYVSGVCTVCESKEPVAGQSTVNCDFSTVSGTQYADETKSFGDVISVSTYNGGCHFNTQLRIYQSSTKDGYAVITSTKVVDSLTINAGNKVATLEVYGSVDGVEWTLIQSVATVAAYANYNVAVGAANNYKYIKLDAVGDQVRVASVAVTVVD